MLLSQLTEKQIQLITNQVFVAVADVFVHQEEENKKENNAKKEEKENSNTKESISSNSLNII